MGSKVHHAFHADIERQLRARLTRSQISLAPTLAPVDVAVRYFDFKRRVAGVRPRRVHVSDELTKNALSSDLQDGVDCIVHDLTVGAPLDPYFSQKWLDLESNDVLFNDWRVRHMHLGGRRLDPDGFVRRTRSVLFVYLEREAAYLVDVLEHGAQNATTFAEPRIVEALRLNWPQIIEHARVPGVSELSLNDAESRWKLSRRQRGPRLSLAVETSDGAVYAPIGGGYMTDGRSTNAVHCAFALLNKATDWKDHCNQKSALIHDHVQERAKRTVDTVELEFAVRHLEWGVEYRVVDKLFGVSIGRGGRILLPEYERR